ncbi:MAG: M1 family metallopeptidase [Gemmatimonadota bacterium]
MFVRRGMIALFVLAVGGCATGAGPESEVVTPAAEPELAERPIPYPVDPPPEFRRAIERDTRTTRGVPGAEYWQQWVDYDIDARVDVEARTLTGAERITYHNNSPHELPFLVINLAQNYHAEGVERVRPTDEVTGGVAIERVAVEGRELNPTTSQRVPGWMVQGTVMYLVLPEPIAANATATLAIDWSFPIPQRGASGRMGYSGDELLYLAYWFPQVAVFDDVIGWHADAFRGNAEFYSDFGHYRMTVDAPEGWLVMSTGSLDNPEEVLAPDVAERLAAAESSDDVVHVVRHEDAGAATARAPDGRLQWEFTADSVRDVAFAVMREYGWDAARAPVGDRDGDGETEYTRVDAFWRAYARNYDDAWRYAQHSIDFLSRYTGLPYPWPHMSVVEGGGIIGGGMEFPMMTLIGDYNQAGADALYNVTAHELGHMWVPMIVNTNERRYAWLDEGTTTFNENNARAEFFEGEDDPYPGEQASYLNVVRSGMEGPIMRWSDFHRPGPAYGVASYAKPAAVLHALRGVLGEERFNEAHRAFYDRWGFKNAYPWDLFNTFEDVAGEELDWFWRSWYYESTQDGDWYLDHAVAAVERLDDGRTRITIDDLGWVVMPVHLRIVREDGEVLERVIPVDRWLAGADQATITVPAGPPVQEVVIDPEGYFPDLDPRNDVWRR